MAKAFLGEPIPALRWLALGIIVAGVGLQAFTAPKNIVPSPNATPRK